VRFDASQQPQRIVFCQGKSLRVGKVMVRAKREDACFEIDLDQRNSPVISGPTDAVELVEVAGVKLWPK